MYSHLQDAFQHAISALARQQQREVKQMQRPGNAPAVNLVGKDDLQ